MRGDMDQLNIYTQAPHLEKNTGPAENIEILII
jgi:hypothetical protein